MWQRIMSRIYEELLKINNKKKTISRSETLNGEKFRTETLLKKIYGWAINT